MNPTIIPIDWYDSVFWLPVGFHPMVAPDFSDKLRLAMNTKIKTSQPAASSPANPVFPFVIRQRGVKAVPPKAKAEKRDNIFSKSRDTREDRGERQMKTSNNVQSLPHGH
jgi:hypothetical protein